MVDVDRLKEAVGFDNPNTAERQTVHDAARLVVAGQPLWWCERHEVAVHNADRCPLGNADCRMVEGWWTPTGGEK